jgi:uncharacterized protein YbaP (TraB family)
MKTISFLVFAVTMSFFVAAQSTPALENTLLWRISGKQLIRPSYLYGTMHLSDDRIFNLSDSLFRAIENAEGFAVEVDPDEMMTVVMEHMINDFKQSRLLKDVISRKAFNRYSQKLEKLIKKDAEDITVKDVIQVRNSWMKDSYSKGSMPVFLDIWLYDNARKLGKWVGGIEDIEDQAGLLEDVFNEQDLEFMTADGSKNSKNFLEGMMSDYLAQDITKMESTTASDDPAYKDLLLIRRNRKMARRMDSLASVRTMVFAVGAAHLAGDSGVIRLLRQKGFTVEPVYSNKKIAGKNYKVDAKPLKWQKITDSKGYYEVDMPGKASKIKVYGLIEMRIHIDLFNSDGFLAMAIPNSLSTNNPDSLLLALARNVSQDERLKQGKSISKNGIAGREYIARGRKGYEHLQLYYANNTIYAAMAFFQKEQGLTDGGADRFFSSLALFQKEQRREGMVSFNGKFPGLLGMAPVELEENKEMLGSEKTRGLDVKLLTGLDIKSQTLYMLIAKSTTEDKYIPNDSLHLQESGAAFSKEMESMDYDSIRYENGYYSLEQKGNSKKDNYYVHSKSYIDGNRMYAYIVITPDNEVNKKKAGELIGSFQLAPVPSLTWRNRPVEEGYSATWAPADFKKLEEDNTGVDATAINTFVSRDSLSGQVYFLIRRPLDTILWYNGEEEFWKDWLEQLKEKDSIVKKTPFTSKGFKGYDVEISAGPGANKASLYRLFVYGDTLYTLFTCLPLSLKNEAGQWNFFNEVSFAQPAPVATVFTSKAKSFLGALESPDSSTRAYSYENFYQARFIAGDIPLLRSYLLKHYDWDTSSSHYRIVQRKIADKLHNLEDSALADFCRENYKDATNLDAEEKTAILYELASVPSTRNLDIVFEELKGLDDTNRVYNALINILDDSLALLQHYSTGMLQLLKKKNMIEPCLRIVNKMMDSNLVRRDDLLPYETEIVSNLQSLVEQKNDIEDEGGWDLEDAALVAGKLNTTRSKKVLESLLQYRNNDIAIRGVMGLLEANEPAPSALLTRLAADPRQRTRLWNVMEAKNKQATFPSKYAGSKWLAEAAVYDFGEEESPISSVTDLGTKKVRIRENDMIVYFFLIGFSENEERYLASAAVPADGKMLKPADDLVQILWSEEYNPKQKLKQMNQLVEQLGEGNNLDD